MPFEVFGLKFQNFEINLENLSLIFNNLEHHATCNNCNSKIKGLRFKCDTCINYDLCFNCYKNKNDTFTHFVNDHPLIIQNKESCLEFDANNIELIEKIGEGGFGNVFKAKFKNNQKLIACKIMKNELADRVLTFNELFAFNELKGVNLLKMFGFCFRDNNLWILTEYMIKGSLANLLRNECDLSLKKRLNITCGIVSGMARSNFFLFFVKYVMLSIYYRIINLYISS